MLTSCLKRTLTPQPAKRVVNKAVKDDIARMERAEEDRVRAEALNRMNELAAEYGRGFTDQSVQDVNQAYLDNTAKKSMDAAAAGQIYIPGAAPAAEYRGEIFGDGLSTGTWEDIAAGSGGLDSLLGTDSLVDASNIIAGDKGLQATLNALQGLGQAGYTYDPNAQSYKNITGADAGSNNA